MCRIFIEEEMAKKYLQLSQILKKLLFERNMRPSDLAKALNIPPPTIHRIVTGASTRPYKSSLKPIAEYFDVNVEQLLGEAPLVTISDKYPDVQISKNNKLVPIISWENIENTRSAQEATLVVGGVSDESFALKNLDYSMEPLFQKGSILIFDPKVIPTDRSYVLIKLHDLHIYVFRQLLVDVNQRFIKSLNPETSAASMRVLNIEDQIIACLVESRNSF